MKLIVFGATGTVGKLLVAHALEQKHQVTAFVRGSKESLAELGNKNLDIFEGDVFDPHSVANAVKGHDAVFCVLGAGRKGIVRAKGTRNIIDAMKKMNVKRFICQSTLGAGESRDHLNFYWKYVMFGWLLKEAYKDHQLQEEYVKQSGLDWTLVRPAAFTNGPATGIFKHGFDSKDRSVKLKISPADIAVFLLMQLDSDEYIRKPASLSY